MTVPRPAGGLEPLPFPVSSSPGSGYRYLMYATCLFCNQPLGANEVLEAFPVGRRIAFDSAKGRLWVVCRKCERWNLSPMEERWETMEECERLFHDTRTRVSTENIGLARLREGLELVRIGQPLRPEFAAWRYGDQFGRRRRRAILYGAGAVAVVGVVMVGGVAAGAISGGLVGQVPNWFNIMFNARTRLRLRTSDGRVIKLKNQHLRSVRILPGAEGEAWVVSVDRGRQREVFQGPEAERVAARIVPKLNMMGGRRSVVRDAVRQIEDQGGPDAFLRTAISAGPQMYLSGLREAMLAGEKLSRRRGFGTVGLVGKLPTPTRLAIEMALHEEQERRALEGELKGLEAAWQQAEEIASISDDLLLPAGAEEFIEEHRTGEERVTDGESLTGA